MQSNIKSFFKPNSSPALQKEAIELFENLPDEEKEDFTREPEVPIKYTRRPQKSHRETDGSKFDYGEQLAVSNSKTVLNKKRKYAQFHLDFGQSDFMFRNCKICGLKFVPGDEQDTKLHKEYHKNYTHGIGFKGWRNERVIELNSLEKWRVILVQNDDPPAHIKKVEEVIKMMEMELGDGWIFHKDCKVYLFISSSRVAGCLVAEPIKKAYRLVSNSDIKTDAITTQKEGKLTSTTTLQFGGISFQREVIRKNPSNKNNIKQEDILIGAILCEKDAMPAVCGVRAIWVTPANRRKHVATRLLEATRKSFCSGLILEHGQLAFSQPTNAGKLLATSYTNTKSFLIYTTNSLNVGILNLSNKVIIHESTSVASNRFVLEPSVVKVGLQGRVLPEYSLQGMSLYFAEETSLVPPSY